MSNPITTPTTTGPGAALQRIRLMATDLNGVPTRELNIDWPPGTIASVHVTCYIRRREEISDLWETDPHLRDDSASTDSETRNPMASPDLVSSPLLFENNPHRPRQLATVARGVTVSPPSAKPTITTTAPTPTATSAVENSRKRPLVDQQDEGNTNTEAKVKKENVEDDDKTVTAESRSDETVQWLNE